MPKLFSAAANVTGQIQSRAVTPNTFGGGAGLQEAGKQITSFADLMQKRIETDEISEVNKELSQKRVEWTQNLYDSAENMESGGAGFTENIVKNFEDFSFENPYKTQAAQRAWSQGLASMRSDLTVRSIGIESEARGKKAVADYSTTSQNNQSVVTQDPTQLDSVLKAQLAYIETLPLSAANKTKFSESAGTDLAEAAVRGMIRSNPDLAKQNLKDGVFSKFFDSDETKSLIGEANTAENANRMESARLEKAAADAADDAAAATVDDLYARVYGPDSAKQPSINEIMNNAALKGRSREKAFLVSAINDRLTNQFNNNTNPVVFQNIMSSIKSGTITNPMDIREYSGRGLGTREVSTAVQYLEDIKAVAQGKGTPELELGLGYVDQTQNFLDGFRTSITRTNANTTHPEGDQRFMQFSRAIRKRVADEIAKGPEGNVDALFDSSNKKTYLGPLLNSYKITMQERLYNMRSGMVPGSSGDISNLMFARPVFTDSKGKTKYNVTEEEYKNRISELVGLGFTTPTPRKDEGETMAQFRARVKIMRSVGATP